MEFSVTNRDALMLGGMKSANVFGVDISSLQNPKNRFAVPMIVTILSWEVATMIERISKFLSMNRA